jgi:hypothetical protein
MGCGFGLQAWDGCDTLLGQGGCWWGLEGLTEGEELSGKGGTGCCNDGSALGMYGRGTAISSSGSPCRTGLVSFWSLGFFCLGHANSSLSLFISAELDSRGHDLSQLEPGVNIRKLVRVPRISYYHLINGSDHGQI